MYTEALSGNSCAEIDNHLENLPVVATHMVQEDERPTTSAIVTVVRNDASASNQHTPARVSQEKKHIFF